MTVRRIVARISVSILTLVIGAFLFVDATTWSLSPADPARGRARGCYTAIEEVLGVSSPTWIRDAELLTSVLLLIAVPAAGVRAISQLTVRR